MRYGIEKVKSQNGYEYFGYKENVETNKRTYICHALSREMCNQMLEKITSDCQ